MEFKTDVDKTYKYTFSQQYFTLVFVLEDPSSNPTFYFFKLFIKFSPINYEIYNQPRKYKNILIFGSLRFESYLRILNLYISSDIMKLKINLDKTQK